MRILVIGQVMVLSAILMSCANDGLKTGDRRSTDDGQIQAPTLPIATEFTVVSCDNDTTRNIAELRFRSEKPASLSMFLFLMRPGLGLELQKGVLLVVPLERIAQARVIPVDHKEQLEISLLSGYGGDLIRGIHRRLRGGRCLEGKFTLAGMGGSFSLDLSELKDLKATKSAATEGSLPDPEWTICLRDSTTINLTSLQSCFEKNWTGLPSHPALSVRVGNGELNIPFYKIDAIEFDWEEKGKNVSSAFGWNKDWEDVADEIAGEYGEPKGTIALVDGSSTKFSMRGRDQLTGETAQGYVYIVWNRIMSIRRL